MNHSDQLLRRAMRGHQRVFHWLLVGTVASLLLGGSALLVDLGREAPLFAGAAATIAELTRVWTAVLILVTLPLVGAFVLRSLLVIGASRELARLGGGALLLHTVLMVAAFGLAVLLSELLLPLVISDLSLGFLTPPDPATGGEVGGLEWLAGASSTIRAAGARLMLPMLLLSSLLAAVLLWRYADRIPRLLPLLDRVLVVLLTMVVGLLLFMPVSFFAAVYLLVGAHGLDVFLAFLGFVVWQIVVILAFLGLLFAIASIFGGLPSGELLRALLPTYVLAATSRSSYACIASTTESALRVGRLPDREVEAAIPAMLVLFRGNRSFTAVLALLFLAHAFDCVVPLDLLLSFMLLNLIATVSTPGLPGGRMTNMPFHTAVGVPIEAYLLSKSTDDLPDIFKTIYNVTYPIVLLALALRLARRWDALRTG